LGPGGRGTSTQPTIEMMNKLPYIKYDETNFQKFSWRKNVEYPLRDQLEVVLGDFSRLK